MAIVVNGETRVSWSIFPDPTPVPPAAIGIIDPPQVQMAQTAAQAAQGHPTTQMNFPHDVLLTVGPMGAAVHYRAGINPVPTALATHSWLAANGVTLV
jgi:hypothetical protein